MLLNPLILAVAVTLIAKKSAALRQCYVRKEGNEEEKGKKEKSVKTSRQLDTSRGRGLRDLPKAVHRHYVYIGVSRNPSFRPRPSILTRLGADSIPGNAPGPTFAERKN